MTVQPITTTAQFAGLNPVGNIAFGYTASWTLGSGDSGAPTGSELIRWLDRTFQVEGTFSGASVIIEGTNDGTNWETLNDPQGVPLSLTSAGIKQVTEVVLQMRPRVSGGDGSTAITVTAFLRRTLND